MAEAPDPGQRPSQRSLPAAAAGLARPVLDALGPLVPEGDRLRILAALGDVRTDDLIELSLELALAPDAPGCDVAVLLPASVTPSFARDCAPLRALAGNDGVTQVVWEHDASRPVASTGAYVRPVGDGTVADRLALARRAAGGDPALAQAVRHLEGACADVLDRPGDYVGLFPDRHPHPVAALRVPVSTHDVTSEAALISSRVDEAAEPASELAHLLAAGCDRSWLAVSASADGRTRLGVEFAWSPRGASAGTRDLSDAEVRAWGGSVPVIALLRSLEGVRRFDALPPVATVTWLNHVKAGPAGAWKAYLHTRIVRAW